MMQMLWIPTFGSLILNNNLHMIVVIIHTFVVKSSNISNFNF